MSQEQGDEERLAELGYTQELRRDWNVLQNFGASFAVISVITGITTLFSYGLTNGGPAVMASGWIVVSFFTGFVGLSMAEIVSAVPTAGGPYYWISRLSAHRYSAFLSWVTGWFNLLGQVAVTTGISFGLAGLISTAATVKTSFEPTPAKTIGIYAGIIISQGLVNTFGVRTLRYLNNQSIVLHSLGITAFAIAVLAKAPTHQSASFVFGTFNDGGGWGAVASPAYVAVVGILMAQFTITGYDASAHLSEETKNAARAAPIGVITSIGCSFLFGFFLILALLFSIQDLDGVINSQYQQPVLQILLDIYDEDSALALFSLVIITVWHCGLFSLCSNARMMYAFARDGALPKIFRTIDPKFGAPVGTIWLAAAGAFCLALPSLGSSVAYSAATSIATIGLYISYGLPIAATLIWPATLAATRGPFTLGIMSWPIGLVAVLWVLFITVAFCLPTTYPVDSQTLNYTPVAIGVVLFWALGSWFLSARKWFTGPIRHVKAELMGVDESKVDKDGALVSDDLAMPSAMASDEK